MEEIRREPSVGPATVGRYVLKGRVSARETVLPERYARVRISASRAVNADRAITSPTPAWRAASMRSVWTCDTKPTVGIDASAGSRLHRRDGPERIGARAVQIEDDERRRVLPHLGRAPRRASARTPPARRAGPAVVLILDVNIRSSTTAKNHELMIVETQAVGPFFKNGFVLGCEETREAVLIDPGDEVEQLLAFAERQALAHSATSC